MSETIAVAEKQLVVFTLGEQAYAVDISIVREIIQIQPITRVPGTHHSIQGVINLRGSVIPTVDLHICFNQEKAEKDKNTRIVVVNCRNQDVGVIVDSVDEVLRVPVDSIEPATELFTDGNADHVRGLVKLSERMVILLDMDQVLSSR
ncbi:MAG: chemotaxis protein CheW [Dehalococcoidales bacterium]|nr:chemotaxis protein CheW [Dehalococcoidales bacterium]